MRLLLLVFPCAIVSLTAIDAGGKELGVSTPSGRTIYGPEETFEGAIDHGKRQFVLEVAAGAGPEGNLGMLLGWLNKPFRGLEWYAGAGMELNPALHLTLSARYLFNIDGYRPYLSAGYLYDDTFPIKTHSHNVFGEIGYSWVLHRTYHLTFGVGVRRILGVHVRDDSLLHDPEVDQALLDEQVGDVFPWVPTIALRFSRAL